MAPRSKPQPPAEAPAYLRGALPNVPTESLLSPLYDMIGNPTGWQGFLDVLSHSYGGGLSCNLEILTPHILRVTQLQRQFLALEARALAAEGAINQGAKAMLLLNTVGQVVYMNAQAERLVAAADGIVVRAGRLNLAVPRETEGLRQLIGTALSGRVELGQPPGGVMRVTRPSGEAAYELLVAPVPGRITGIGARLGFVVVFIQDPAVRLTTPLAWLRRVFNLSPAEAKLMHALLDGATLGELTELWGVGKETLRSQLRAIFAKTGTASQAELIRLGLRSLTARYR